ncbi:MAG: hypothetical protein GY823_02405 [Flavobacteriaceae bacterium]|nr:hypothetical protein [Flavobacteriaceae bacterium]
MNTQLDLFEGLVLTTEQQEKIDSFINSQAKNAVVSQENINKTMLLLDEAGFVQGVDYNSNYEVHEVTREVEFGYSYNNTQFEHEVTYLNAVGGVYLIVDTIKEGKIVKYNAPVSREGNKLMCTSITEQYRYYKPSSLYVKLYEYNERKVNELEHNNKQKIALDIIVAKYQKLYPKAKVTIGSDYYRRSYTSFPTVKVKFESGSSVEFVLGYGNEMDKERFHKKYDAQTETIKDLLERFNNQKAK